MTIRSLAKWQVSSLHGVGGIRVGRSEVVQECGAGVGISLSATHGWGRGLDPMRWGGASGYLLQSLCASLLPLFLPPPTVCLSAFLSHKMFSSKNLMPHVKPKNINSG